MISEKKIKSDLVWYLNEAGWDSTMDDVIVTECKKGYNIILKGYEHLPFTMILKTDEYCGYVVSIKLKVSCVIFEESQVGYPIARALIHLSRYIANTF